MSPLEQKRLAYVPRVPVVLMRVGEVALEAVEEVRTEGMKELFPKTFEGKKWRAVRGEGRPGPLKVGAYFSGGPASGGHNVLAGLFDAIYGVEGSRLVGFIEGAKGLVEGNWKELTKGLVDRVRNQGGFDLIGASRVKLEKEEDFRAAKAVVEELELDALVVIGGDDSNTNAALLAEWFLKEGVKTRVVGVPKTIDGDLRSEDIEMSFGFDSACKTYAELIGNVARDALSSRKYYHFIKLMGRSASHIALECALACHPNLTLIGEEGKSLEKIVGEIADLIVRRFQEGKNYGVVLIPEGLVEFIPEIKELIAQLNGLLAKGGKHEGEMARMEGEQRVRYIASHVKGSLFGSLPQKIQEQLVLDRDPHGNVMVSQIETESLLMELVKEELKRREFKGKFYAQQHFFGYEGRACLPSNFDANYGYSLGLAAAVAAREGLTGVICAMKQMKRAPEEWEVRYVPIVSLMRLETRHGKKKPVIEKALVDLTRPPYVDYERLKPFWEREDCYRFQGPIQFFGDSDTTDSVPISLRV